MKQSKNLIKLGDIFEIGNHRIGCLDFQNKEMISKLINGNKVKSVNCDIPYGIAVVESKINFQPLSKNKIIANDHIQTDEEYTEFNRKWLEAIIPHMEKKNSFYIFNSDKMIFALRQAMLDVGMKFSQLLVWVKSHAVIGRMDYAPQHELIAVGWYGTHTFRKSKDKSVLLFPKPNRSKLHPSTKPVELIRRLILNSTEIGDIVYDGCLGSGTCAVACEQTKRICYGCDIDPEYVATTIMRLEKLLDVKAKKIL